MSVRSKWGAYLAGSIGYAIERRRGEREREREREREEEEEEEEGREGKEKRQREQARARARKPENPLICKEIQQLFIRFLRV